MSEEGGVSVGKESKKPPETEDEHEPSEPSVQEIEDYGESYGAEYPSGLISEKEFFDDQTKTEWEELGEFGEGGKFAGAGEAEEYRPAWGEGGSVTSEISSAVSEEEETEEEKELRKERESLIETVRQKLGDRLLLRRRNAFLQKKLIENLKKRRMFNAPKEEPKGLQFESKYLKLLFGFNKLKLSQEHEMRDVTHKMEKFEADIKRLDEDLSNTLDNYVNRAKEVSLNLISSKTGKRINDKVVERLLRRQIQKNEEKGKRKLHYIKVKNLIAEHEAHLKSMEYFGNGLNIADYEQLKIDNQNYTDKIEEKEEELTKMRLKTQGIVQNLTHVKEKTFAIEADIELMEEKVYEVEKKFIETRENLTKSRKKRDFLREELVRLKSASGLLARDDLLRDFETSIFQAKNLSKTLEKIQKLLMEKKKQEAELSKIFKF